MEGKIENIQEEVKKVMAVLHTWKIGVIKEADCIVALTDLDKELTTTEAKELLKSLMGRF